MDKKLLSTVAIIAVVIVSMASVIAFDASRDDNSSTTTYNVLARVNSEGSGIYINNSDITSTIDSVPARNDTPYYVNDSGVFTVSEANKAAWGGLIVGTPGETSIQHVQMKQLVESMGLKFERYDQGQSTNPDSVYYISTIVNYDKAINSQPKLDLGILWEPQFSRIADNLTFTTLGLTNNFFPGHTCCVLAGYTPYINSHEDVTVRFLAAYVEAVKWVQEANADGATNYDKFVNYCVEATGLTANVVKSAIGNITYVYGDGEGTDYVDLHKLKSDVAGIVNSNKSTLRYNMSDLGFNNPIQFANRFVDDSYLSMATDRGTEHTSTNTVTVAAIAGDIHQIALHVGVKEGIFEKYGINVDIAFQPNGAGVAVALQNGNAQFGFLGAPPATITAVNGQLITV